MSALQRVSLRPLLHLSSSTVQVMLCIECNRNEVIGGFYCDECGPTPPPSPEQLAAMAVRFGPVRKCVRCQDEYRSLKPTEKKCVGCRTFG